MATEKEVAKDNHQRLKPEKTDITCQKSPNKLFKILHCRGAAEVCQSRFIPTIDAKYQLWKPLAANHCQIWTTSKPLALAGD